MTTPTPSPEAEALPTLPVVASRDAFEAWEKSRGGNITRHESGIYANSTMQGRWTAWHAGWQASRCAPAEAAIVALRAERDQAREDCASAEAHLHACLGQIKDAADERDALRAEVAELRKERNALIQAGAPMANTMFNLAQKFDPVLFTRRDCELFRIMQINWDAARASLLGDGGTL